MIGWRTVRRVAHPKGYTLGLPEIYPIFIQNPPGRAEELCAEVPFFSHRIEDYEAQRGSHPGDISLLSPERCHLRAVRTLTSVLLPCMEGGVPGRMVCTGCIYQGVHTRVYHAGYPTRTMLGIPPVLCWVCTTCTMLGMHHLYHAGYARLPTMVGMPDSLPWWVFPCTWRVFPVRKGHFCTFNVRKGKV